MKKTACHTAHLIASAILGMALLLTAASPAFADDSVLQGVNLTLSQTSGGKATRFTFTAAPNQPLAALTLEFPEGFGLQASRIDAVTLSGLNRTKVATQDTVLGQTAVMRFTPPIAAGNSLRVQVFDVILPARGGQETVKVRYEAGPVKAVTSTPPFSWETVTMSQQVAKWLEVQSAVKAWNSVGFLNIFLQPQMVARSVPILFAGWLLSIALVVVAFPIAIIGGLALAFAKMARFWPLRALAGVYINVIRGTPLFLQIFIAFVGLPIAGIRAPLFPTGVFVLALNSSAYLAEIFRAGIQSINKGQFEAASSLGMSYAQAMAFVVIPQTVKRVLPTMTSEFILLFKDTALLSAVGVFELMLFANSLATNSGSLTPFMVAAVYYLLVTIPLITWVGTLERKLAISEGGQVPDKKVGRNWWRTAPALGMTDDNAPKTEGGPE